MLYSTIATGNVDAADIFFLIGAILGVIAAIVHYARPALGYIGHALVALAVACVAFALMLL